MPKNSFEFFFANENMTCFFAEAISADVFRDSRMRKISFEFLFSREPAIENPELELILSRKRSARGVFDPPATYERRIKSLR